MSEPARRRKPVPTQTVARFCEVCSRILYVAEDRLFCPVCSSAVLPTDGVEVISLEVPSTP